MTATSETHDQSDTATISQLLSTATHRSVSLLREIHRDPSDFTQIVALPFLLPL